MITHIMASFGRWSIAHVPQPTMLSPVLRKNKTSMGPSLFPGRPNPAALWSQDMFPFTWQTGQNLSFQLTAEKVRSWRTLFLDGEESSLWKISLDIQLPRQEADGPAQPYEQPNSQRSHDVQPPPSRVLPPRWSSPLVQVLSTHAQLYVPPLTR